MYERAYQVYVIELRCRLHCREVCVGSSALPPAMRFRQHKARQGIGASGMIAERGLRLRRDLAPSARFQTREHAKRAEKHTRARLEKKGYVVHGACAKTDNRRCVL